MTTLVKQRTLSDCTICCIAMAINKPYEEVEAVGLSTGEYSPTKGTGDPVGILEKFGLVEDEANSLGAMHKLGDFRHRHKNWPVDPIYFREAYWGRRAIISVPSLNKEGGYHSVYYDGHTVYDPSNLKTYETFEQLVPRDILVFRENVG